MIVAHGFDGLSMQKLAAAASVSPATIYIYFRDRDDLILRLHEEETARMAEFTLRGFDPDGSFAEGLRVQWQNRIRYCLEYPRQSHFLEQMRYSPLFQKAAEVSKRPFSQTMERFVKGAIQRGEIVRLPVEVYWSVAFAPLYQLLRFHQHGLGFPGKGPFVLDQKTIDQTLSLVLKALKP